MNQYVLAGAYWLHMAATVVWIGGLFYQSAVLTPAILRIEDSGDILERLRKRFQPLAWLSLAVLVGTGLVQMSANDNYQGLLSLGNLWSQAILLKHAAVGGMVVVGIYQTWVVQPRLASVALIKDPARRPNTLVSLRRLTRVNLVLGLVVLGFTALARTL